MLSLVFVQLHRIILTPRQDDLMFTESAAIFPFQRFLFQVATTSASGLIDFSIDARARSAGAGL